MCPQCGGLCVSATFCFQKALSNPNTNRNTKRTKPNANPTLTITLNCFNFPMFANSVSVSSIHCIARGIAYS